MKNNKIALKKAQNALLDDRINSNIGLSKLIKTEIVQALSNYLEIDTASSTLSVSIEKSGVVVDCHVVAFAVKRFALNS